MHNLVTDADRRPIFGRRLRWSDCVLQSFPVKLDDFVPKRDPHDTKRPNGRASWKFAIGSRRKRYRKGLQLFESTARC